MFGRILRVALPVAVTAFALATAVAQAATGGPAAPPSEAKQAADTVLTLVGVGLLLWIVGNILTKHNYSTRGPKGEKLSPPQ